MSSNLADQLTQIKNSINEAEKELALLQSGRKVSASRARKQLQNIKNQSQVLRKSVILYSKEIPTKKRTVKIAPEPVAESVAEPVAEPVVESFAESKLVEQTKKRTNKSKKLIFV